jgi:hypothetical protein
MSDVLTHPLVSPAINADLKLGILSRLYLGRRIPDHVPVHSSRDRDVRSSGVNRFVSEVLSRNFPDGFVLLDAAGGWANPQTGQAHTEPSLVVEIVHSKAQAPLVKRVAEEWKRWFSQDAAMIVSTQANVEFV